MINQGMRKNNIPRIKEVNSNLPFKERFPGCIYLPPQGLGLLPKSGTLLTLDFAVSVVCAIHYTSLIACQSHTPNTNMCRSHIPYTGLRDTSVVPIPIPGIGVSVR
jgi:hypothetical protein